MTRPNPLPRRARRAVVATAAAGVLVLGAAACGGGDDDTASDEVETLVEGTTPSSPDTTAASSDTSAPGGSSGETGDSPSWAKPYETPGEQIATIEGEGFEVAVYQVGVAPATKTGNFVDPDTNEPIIDVGDEVVFVNYVLTNTSGEAIPLSYSLVNIDPEYDDWPYMQGMDSITDSALYEQMGVNSDALAPGSGDAPFMWEPGTSFAYGTNFRYQAGSPITFEATLVPADDAGDLLHDQRKEASASATIT